MSSLRPFPRNGNLRTIGPALLYVNVEWCPHCRAARPLMEKVAGVLGSVVPVYSVDGDDRADLAQELGVKGFPTIVLITQGGARYLFDQERSLDAITSFVCHNAASHYDFCKRVR